MRWIPFKFKNQGLNDQQKRLLDGYTPGGQMIPPPAERFESNRPLRYEGRPEGEVGNDEVVYHSIRQMAVDGTSHDATFILTKPIDRNDPYEVEYSAVVVDGDQGQSVVRIYRDDDQYSSHIVAKANANKFAATEIVNLSKRGY